MATTVVQLQVLNYVINTRNIDFLTTYSEKYFFNYKDEYNFILNHYHKHKNVPNIETVLSKFPDFTPIDVTESETYLQQKLFEDYVYNTAVEVINSNSKEFTKDAVKAKDIIIAKLQEITPPVKKYGVDIIKEAPKRYDMLLDKMVHKEEYVFSSGLTELDIILNGGIRRGEELIVLYARTNNAKTWIAEKLMVSIWEQNYNVGFFSPEMSSENIGYRFDTLFKNFDNHGIMGNVKDFDSEPYKKYVNTLARKDRPIFNVATPEDFPDKRVTVTAITKWVETHNLKAIAIDGLTYMTNERSNGRKNTTENLTEICEDLMRVSISLKIPIIVVLQANREGARDRDGEVSTEAPELDTIRGSDGISHNASRCISLYKSKDIIKLYLNKNRYGEKGQHLYYHYEVNTGKFTYTPNPKDGIPIDTAIEDEFKEDTGTPF